MGKRIVGEFEVVDLGADHNQYFQGFGLWGSKYSHAVTGQGFHPAEAMEDALSQIAMMGYDVDDLVSRDAFMAEADGIQGNEESSIPLIEEGDGTEEAPEGTPNPEWYHYVGIRWNDY